MRSPSDLKHGIDFTGITIVFICHDGKGNYLFSKRGVNCRDEHGTWDPGGGALEFGHTVLDTLQKEIFEEYRTNVINSEFLGYRDVHRKRDNLEDHWLALDFKVLVDRDIVRNGEPHKLDEIGWFKLDNLPEPVHSQFPTFLSLYQDRL